MAKDALRSLIAQDEKDLCIIISDNSTTDEVENWVMSSRFPRQIYYAHWQPTLPPPHAHAYKIFNAANTFRPSYWQLFHDDDIALPDMVSKMRSELERDPSLAAVAPNALEYTDRRVTRLMRLSGQDVRIESPREMLANYFLPSVGVAPCPGYLYRGATAQVIEQGLKGGKYMDIWTNCGILRFGAVKWLAKPLMLYQRHGQQDSFGHSVKAKFGLFHALVENGVITKADPVYGWFFLQNFKHFVILRKTRHSVLRAISSKKGLLAIGFALQSLLRPATILLLFQKTCVRFRPIQSSPETLRIARGLLETPSREA